MFGYSQIDSSYLNGDVKTSKLVDYHATWNTFPVYKTKIVEGNTKTPIQVMDSGIKVEVFESRDTLYNCPTTGFTYYLNNGEMVSLLNGCKFDKVITTRRYKMYVINEEGKKEYLLIESQIRK